MRKFRQGNPANRPRPNHPSARGFWAGRLAKPTPPFPPPATGPTTTTSEAQASLHQPRCQTSARP
jgi:hypothetical protein